MKYANFTKCLLLFLPLFVENTRQNTIQILMHSSYPSFCTKEKLKMQPLGANFSEKSLEKLLNKCRFGSWVRKVYVFLGSISFHAQNCTIFYSCWERNRFLYNCPNKTVHLYVYQIESGKGLLRPSHSIHS